MYYQNFEIKSLDVQDIRFPTSLGKHGSDAMHTDPDYSCAYVTISLKNTCTVGNGLTFTLGRGTEIVVAAIHSLSSLVVGEKLGDIYNNFRDFWRKLTSESQIRWIGPEKGVIHLAVAAIINALWDLWARLEEKPLWRLLVDMSPEQLVSVIDFRYITDAITEDEAIQFLREGKENIGIRVNEIISIGYPAYTTQIGWLGYTDTYMKEMGKKFLDLGFKDFKLKVGTNLEEDIHRCKLAREIIGWNNNLMVDANQVWDTNEAIEWMKQLKEFKIKWIEEPTSPDDIVGHAKVSKALEPYGIGVATGEMCCNRVMFKQLLQMNAIQYCQIDSARIGGVNEILSVYLMAKKFGVPVCPHAGGVGLCEMVQHLQMWDYCALTKTKDNRIIEYVDQQHEHFEDPTLIKNAKYQAPMKPGYSTRLKKEAIDTYKYPCGSYWKSINN